MNKLKNKLLVLTLAGLGMTLASCNVTVQRPSSSEGPSDETTSEITSDVTSDSKSDPEETSSEETSVNTTSQIIVDAAEGTAIHVENNLTSAEFGDVVTFTVETTKENYALNQVLIDGEPVHAKEGAYSFTVKKTDMTISTTSICLGQEGIETLKPFESADELPSVKTLDGLKALIQNALLTSGEYFAEAWFATDTTDHSSYDDYFNLQIEAGINDVLNIDGSKMNYYSSKKNAPVHDQIFIEDNRLVMVEGTVSGNEWSENFQSFEIVEKSEDHTLPTTDEAKAYVSNYFNLYSALEDSFFKSNYGWENAKFTTGALENRTLAQLTARIVDSRWNGTEIMDFELVIDKDNFIHSLSATASLWDENDIENNEPVAEAKAIKESSLNYHARRGYKKILPIRNNIVDFVMNDYDVVVSAKFGDSTTELVNGGEVLGNSVLDFSFVCRDDDKFLVSPKFVGFAEGEESFFIDGTQEIGTLGTRHLVFDNGAGELKTIEVTAIEPAATGIEVKAAQTSAFQNTPVEVTVNVTPSTANQDVTLAKADGSVDCAIEAGEGQGKFLVSSANQGTIKLVASSVSNPELAKTLEIEVVEKPTYEAITNVIWNKTLEEQGVGSYGDPFYINFNEDGTGLLARNGYDSTVWEYRMMTKSFTYTLDQETLAFTITMGEGDLDYELVSLSAVTSEQYTGEIDYSTSEKQFAPVARRTF